MAERSPVGTMTNANYTAVVIVPTKTLPELALASAPRSGACLPAAAPPSNARTFEPAPPPPASLGRTPARAQSPGRHTGLAPRQVGAL